MNVIRSLLELFLGLCNLRKQITQIAKAIQHLIALKTYNYLLFISCNPLHHPHKKKRSEEALKSFLLKDWTQTGFTFVVFLKKIFEGSSVEEFSDSTCLSHIF